MWILDGELITTARTRSSLSRNVADDQDDTLIWQALLVNADASPVLARDFEGAPGIVVTFQAFADPSLLAAGRLGDEPIVDDGAQVILEAGARLGELADGLVQFSPRPVGDDDPVLGVEQHDELGKRLDRESELLFGG